MDRLTERNKLGEALLNANLNEKYYPSELIDILDRLTAYEDTGLSPEVIREMMTDWLVWKQAEAGGRLAVLPCKVGDEVYTNTSMSGWYLRANKRPYSAKVVFIGLNASEAMGGGFFNVVYSKGEYMMHFQFSDIGKTVFLTREEAEKALEVK